MTVDLAALRELAEADWPRTVATIRWAIEFYVARWYVNDDGTTPKPKPNSPVWLAVEALDQLPQLLDMVAELQRENERLAKARTGLTYDERCLVQEVCHDLMNRAQRVEEDGDRGSIYAAEDRSKEAAVRKLLGDTP